MNYEAMTVAELKKQATDRKLTFKSKANHAELVALLQDGDKAASAPAPTPAPAPPPVPAAANAGNDEAKPVDQSTKAIEALRRLYVSDEAFDEAAKNDFGDLKVEAGEEVASMDLQSVSELLAKVHVPHTLDLENGQIILPEENDDDDSPEAAAAPVGFFGGLRALRELGRRAGAAWREFWTVTGAIEALEAVGVNPFEEKESEPVFWAFDGEYVGDGPVTAQDPDGNWRAVVFNDGRAEISFFAAPNLNARRPGQRVLEDVALTLDSLDEFADRIIQLVDGSDSIIHNSLSRLADERVATAVSEEAPATEEQEEPSEDPEDVRMIEAADEYGLQGIGLDQLPYKLAEALGIEARSPKMAESGEPMQNAEGQVVYGDLLPLEEVRAKVLEHL